MKQLPLSMAGQVDNRLNAKALLCLLLIFASHPCRAADPVNKGTADQITPPPAPLQSLPTQPQQRQFTLPPVASPSQSSQIDVTGFRFEGNTVISTSELQMLAAPYIGRRLGSADLEELRNRLTRLYIDRGYLNSGALLAALPVAGRYPGGIVPIRIIEGRIADVRIKGLERLRPQYLRDRLINDDEVLNIDVLQERFRLLLADPLFERINSRIVPGDELGKAVLDVDVVRAKPYALSVFANNYRPPSIGAEGVGLTGWVRNLSGFGDVLDSTVQHSQGTDPIHVGWSMPLGGLGTSIRLSYDHGNSSVIEEPLNAIDIRSRTTSREIGVGQTLIDRLKRKVDIGLSYTERKSQTTLLSGQPFSFTPGEPEGVSQVKVWRLSQDWIERWESRALALRSVFSIGRNNVDAEGNATPVAARHYAIWTGQFQFAQNVSDNGTQLVLRGTTQQTGARLVPLERFSIGGVGTVRGYRENSVVRDRGYTMNAELHYPLWSSGNAARSLQLIPFVDIGSGRNKDETRQQLASVGLGLNWRHDGLSADLYLAKKLKRLPIETHGDLQDRGIHFQLSYNLF